MGEDASLDDFLDADDDKEAEPAETDDGPEREESGSEGVERDGSEIGVADAVEDPEEDVEDADDESSRDPATVEPAAATYDWSPDGATCAACEEVVERRWRGDPGFVCESCKDW